MTIRSITRAGVHVAIAAAAIAALARFGCSSRAEQPPGSPTPPSSSTPEIARPQAPALELAAAATTAPRALAHTPPINISTRSGQLQALLAKGAPAADFEAYMLLANCETAQANQRNAHNPPAFFSPDMRQQLAAELANGSAADAVRRSCGDLTANQVAGRFALLQRAAEAGVAGAAVQLVMQPPAGMTQDELQARWESPEILQWRERSLALIKLAATKADLDALLLLKTIYREGSPLVPQPDTRLAFVYATAYDAVYSQQKGKPPGIYHRNETNQLEAAVPPGEAQQLREQGLKLAQGGVK